MGIDYVDVKDHCIDGKCSRCGECCGDYLPITGTELETIRRYVWQHKIKPYKNKVVNLPIDITCPFLNGKKLCVIYEVRPSICRTFKCDMPIEEMRKNKMEHHINPGRKPMSMREEIFDEPNPFDVYVDFLRKHMED
jgi:Fe-S-cluster containining protein